MIEQQARVWKRILSEKMADCRVFDVYRDICVDAETEESEATFYRLHCPDWCNVVPITTDNKIVLIEQFRQGIQEIALEIPGGIVDEGELPETAAARELLEETGYVPGTMIYVGKSNPNPAIQNNFVHHFLALDCEFKQEPEFDSHEHVVVRLTALDEVENLIETEKITHSLVLAGLYRAQRELKKNSRAI